MSNNDDQRVLGRKGARELSAEELNKILGAAKVHTLLPSSPFHPDF
jgi:hypothetical protein